MVLVGKNIGSACFLYMGALSDRTPHELDMKWSTFIKYKLNCLYHTGYCLNCIYILYNFLSAAKGRVEKKMENSILVDGWGQHLSNFPLSFFFEKKLKALDIA